MVLKMFKVLNSCNIRNVETLVSLFALFMFPDTYFVLVIN